MLMQEAVLKMKKKKTVCYAVVERVPFSNHLILHAAALAIGASQ